MGKRLMATAGAPVYDNSGEFRGTVAIGLTLATLSDCLKDPELQDGTAMIVNDDGQVLAHPTRITGAEEDVLKVEDMLPGFDADVPIRPTRRNPS